jgi:hypothetical protein
MCPETETSSNYCAQVSRFHLQPETESSVRDVVLKTEQWILFRIRVFIAIAILVVNV